VIDVKLCGKAKKHWTDGRTSGAWLGFASSSKPQQLNNNREPPPYVGFGWLMRNKTLLFSFETKAEKRTAAYWIGTRVCCQFAYQRGNRRAVNYFRLCFPCAERIGGKEVHSYL
jgi:hypothetical protein